MIIGMTGNRDGIFEQARETLIHILDNLEAHEAHHGDCVGADAEFHELAVKRMPIIIHPPTNKTNRSFCEGAKEVLKPREYLERNKDIVDSSELLIAIPSTLTEYERSGTWSTVRYARTLGRPIIIIQPHGKIKLENCKYDAM